jgi:hypothetical protein
MALVSTFEILVKPQLPPLGVLDQISRKVIQGYFLTIANVNFFDVTISVVFTLRFPKNAPGSPTPKPRPISFEDFLNVVDISGENIFPQNPNPQGKLVPEVVPANNKARITFTLPANGTGLLLLQANIIKNDSELLKSANFEARGYVEIFLSSLSGSDTATLLVTPEHRGTFFKNLDNNPTGAGLDQIAYALPVSNGGVFKLSNQ